MPLNRSSIQRGDFPVVRRGYDPAAVDAHLRALADELEAAGPGGGSRPMAAAASEQVHTIVEAAERTAQQMQEEASVQAGEHVARVSSAAAELLGRIEAMHEELGTMLERLRSLEGDVDALGGAEPVAPEPVTGRAAKPEDEEAARLVALDMALGGTPREETERYLADHYDLADPGAVLDDVYALAGP